MKNPMKALDAIETLVSSGFCQDLEWDAYQHPKALTKRERQAGAILEKVYMIAHSETKHTCTHKEWEDIKFKVKRSL